LSIRIPIKSIAIIDRQRKVMDQAKLTDLANKIKELGRLIHPIRVRRPRPEELHLPELKSADWVLVAGGRRTAAHIMLGLDTIEANDWDQMTAEEAALAELYENIGREDITWQEELAAKEQIHNIRVRQEAAKGNKQSLDATAREIGEHKGNLSKDLKLVERIKQDPTLAKAPSKAAAIRQADHKERIQSRIAAIKSVDLSALKERLVTQDMRDFVRQLKPDSVNLHFSDFPFGIDYDQVRTKDSNIKGEYRDDPQTIRDLITDVVPHMLHSLSPKGWFCCMMGWTNYQFLHRTVMSACKVHMGYCDLDWSEAQGTWVRHPKARCNQADEHSCRFLDPEPLPWIWYRPNSRQPSLWPELHANNQYELFCVVNGGEAHLATPNVGNVLAIDAVYSDRIHEMQRPHTLCTEVIRRLTVPGELVVDLCFGSGSSLAAAADLGRNFRGCDINPENLGPALGLVAQYWGNRNVTSTYAVGQQRQAAPASTPVLSIGVSPADLRASK